MIRRRHRFAASALLAVALASCAPAGSNGTAADGTFSIALAGDPGNLDPYHAATFAPAFLLSFSYEGLVARGANGAILPNLAESWEVQPQRARFTLRQGLTCASGEPLTIEDVADNYRYAIDPDNHSPQLGPGGIPPGTRLEVDRAARTITLHAPKPQSFLLEMTGMLPIVCRRGLDKRERLRRRTEGTGLFRISEAVSNSHYMLTRRDGYHWGADGTRSDTPGVPKRVLIRVIPNQTTAANLLLAGELTAATVNGPDRRRLEAAGFRAETSRSPALQMWFNQAPDRPAADPNVRRALVLAIDVPQLARIASAGMGITPVRLSGAAPMACPTNIMHGAGPRFDTAAANALLDRSGWVRGGDGIRVKAGRRLSLLLSWDQDLNDPTASAYAAEYAVSQWRAIGAEVRARGVSGAAVSETLFGTGNYDISWTPIVVSMPNRFLLFASGSPPPNGLNFPHVRLAGIDALVEEANRLQGAASCPKWDAIERRYLDDAAVLPVFDGDNAVLTRDARFTLNGLLLRPTSIRLTGR